MLDLRGDFNGSCRPRQRDTWLSICPDANLIAQIPAHELRPSPIPLTLRRRGSSSPLPVERRRGRGWDLLAKRKRCLGQLEPELQQKLHMVRGCKQWLYDVEGQRYLDGGKQRGRMSGHSHPQVVKAGQAQMAVLNTNTRYLHENMVRYAERIAATLPAPLRVCFFVNSGSEANELALRLARAHTRQKDMVVVDVGYHGNTTSMCGHRPVQAQPQGRHGCAGLGSQRGYTGWLSRCIYKASDPMRGANTHGTLQTPSAGAQRCRRTTRPPRPM